MRCSFLCFFVSVWLTGFLSLCAGAPGSVSGGDDVLAGSVSCRKCHEAFYELWATSHHGLAMQPYTAEFARGNLTAHNNPVVIRGNEYRAFIGGDEGWVLERNSKGETKHRIVHVLGGRNVYYFLTPMERGRLQTLPVAYDVRLREWFDTAASGVRHFPGGAGDEALAWRDSAYTFNTSCYGCHVSQLATNYNIEDDTYNTTWAEPGINCEACHGPSQKHVELYRSAKAGETPESLELISTKEFSVEQTNAMCNSCHAKMSPVSASFGPGERFFDHFDLMALENCDFYPDGRDLGENYTMTGWLMSGCVKSGKLDCVHCHTSSGRYRFAKAENPNAACIPCHAERVENAASHTHHKADSEGNRCVACHMPTTAFARMTRSDHSMRPPIPAATIKFKSPNACNLCHKDKDAVWADGYVRKWHENDYQRPLLEWAGLVDEARGGKWGRLEEMLAYVDSENRDEVVAVSLMRLLANCDSERKWPAIIKVLKEDDSPLVRGAAARTLEGYFTAESVGALCGATSDEYRLVRVRAASALSSLRIEQLEKKYQASVKSATGELLDSLRARPDDYASHYNLGNIQMQRGEHGKALASFQRAIKLRSDFVPPYVNMAFVHNAMGDNDKAEASFRKAISLEPKNAVVHLNLGMLLGEMKRPEDAEIAFRNALKADGKMATAAYNLGVLLASSKPSESLQWCSKAYMLRPGEGRYGYTYAFYLCQKGQVDEGVIVLEDIVRRNVPYGDAYALLATIHLQRRENRKAANVYRLAGNNTKFSQQERDQFKTMERRVEQGL